MFSFFKSTKKSPVVSPSEKTEDHSQKSEDFVHIPNPQSNNIYPSFPMPSIPANSANSPSHHPFNRQYSVTINFTQNVPFKLNSALHSANSENEMWNYKLREMNSVLQRLNLNSDFYDFKLERSIVESS